MIFGARGRDENQNQNQIYSRMTRCYRTLLKFGLLPKRGNGLYHWRH
eukprot:COSAG02_NODE_1019_length_15171_cov_7.663482_23_plen_46_part_01